MARKARVKISGSLLSTGSGGTCWQGYYGAEFIAQVIVGTECENQPEAIDRCFQQAKGVLDKRGIAVCKTPLVLQPGEPNPIDYHPHNHACE